VPNCGYAPTIGLDFLPMYLGSLQGRSKDNNPAGRRLTLAAPAEWLQPCLLAFTGCNERGALEVEEQV
jgi:hypothetical protein